MKQWLGRLRSPVCACMLWVALCFGLTSAVYLSWLDRLVALTGGAADWLSMVLGYLCQALGLGAAALWLHRQPEGNHFRPFAWTSLLFALFSAPALLSNTAAGVIGFGLLMNLMCGGIAGGYLFAVSANVRSPRRGMVFGGGYAVATVAVGLLALAGRGSVLHSPYALLLYLPLAALMVYRARGRLSPAEAAKPAPPLARRELMLSCWVVLLISLVKNLGFCFPSEDIQAGLVPELSRVPYAIGLLAAGYIADRDRKSGMLCAVAALILPFLMLGLTGERVPTLICWGLDYLFFAFFSVFRAALFLDLAAKTRRWSLAPLGLLLGRLGDAAGTGLGLMLAGRRVVLIAVTALLFFPTAWLFYRLYQKLYEPEVVQQRSEQEVFEAFCLRNDLSAREREVLRMVIAEHTNGEIAEALFIAESTVKYHVRNLLQKTGCKNRAELQRKYTLALYPGVGE